VSEVKVEIILANCAAYKNFLFIFYSKFWGRAPCSLPHRLMHVRLSDAHRLVCVMLHRTSVTAISAVAAAAADDDDDDDAS